MIYAVLEFLAGLIGSAFSRVLADEAKAWLPRASARLLRIAIARAPVGRRSRLSEEWSAHLAEIPGDLTKVWNAAGFVTAAHTMCVNEGFTPSMLQRVASQGLAAFLIVASFPMICLISVSLFVVGGRPVFVRRHARHFGAPERLWLNFRRNAFLNKTSFYTLPVLFDLVTGRHVLSKGEWKMLWDGLPLLFSGRN